MTLPSPAGVPSYCCQLVWDEKAHLADEDGLRGGDDEDAALAFPANDLVGVGLDRHELERGEGDTVGWG
jgi:hypothetical protein